MRRRLGGLAFGLVVGALPAIACGEPEAPPLPAPVPIVTLDAIPLDLPLADLPAPARARAEHVLARRVFAHRVIGIRHPSREDVFRFLLDHPDFAASVVRALGLKRYRLEARENGYWGDDGKGASGMVRLLHGDDHRRLYHLAGRYEHRLQPTVEGQLLLLLEFRHRPAADSASVAESTLTGHLALDTPVVGPLAELVARLVRPLVERAVDRKVHRFFETVARVSRWAIEAPEAMIAAIERHPEVEQGARLDAFRAILLVDRPPRWARLTYRLAPAHAEAD